MRTSVSGLCLKLTIEGETDFRHSPSFCLVQVSDETVVVLLSHLVLQNKIHWVQVKMKLIPHSRSWGRLLGVLWVSCMKGIYLPTTGTCICIISFFFLLFASVIMWNKNSAMPAPGRWSARHNLSAAPKYGPQAGSSMRTCSEFYWNAANLIPR